MRLSTLSTPSRASQRAAAAMPRTKSDPRLQHVNEIDRVEADRERSAREELKLVENLPAANDELAHQERAHEAAAALKEMGPAALKLLRYDPIETTATQINTVV